MPPPSTHNDALDGEGRSDDNQGSSANARPGTSGGRNDRPTEAVLPSSRQHRPQPPAGPPRMAHRHSASASASASGDHSAMTATEITSLLRDTAAVHDGPCHHGTFSPRPESPAPTDLHDDDGPTAHWASAWASRIKGRTRMGTSRALAKRHGVEDGFMVYLAYYLPVLVWARQYRLAHLKGDLSAAISMAGMYLPMSLSLADNLAHVPPINGLYAFAINPFIYAMLGSCPSMIVGPEAPGSLLVGSVIKASIEAGRGRDDDAALHAKICGVIGGIAGTTVLAAGLFRLGFLDSVFSRPFLRGFISAIGVVIAVDQLLPELGLTHLAEQSARAGHGSCVDKLRFIFSNLQHVHRLTFALALSSFSVIMVCREMKRHLGPRYPAVAYIPDRFVVVTVAAFLTYWFEWDQAGVAVLGKVEAASGHLFTFRWPFQPSDMIHVQDALGTGFLIALLGFFESSVAAKSLSNGNNFPDIQLSPNRELVALGTANLVGACFMALPAFGGYGRSKVNRQTGGKGPMSAVLLSMFAFMCIAFLLPYFYYLPKPVLSSMISVVAYSLIEECPSDVSFFIKIRAWRELALMLTIVIATIFYSLTFGIAVGIGLSLLMVIRHATRPRIQILGRVPGTDKFENAEVHPERLEFIEGCLIVKVPEPLTFANTGELGTRLRRLELYGTTDAHPALPRLRSEDSSRNVIFDIHGFSMDGSGTQVLEEIVRSYRLRGVRVFFSRGPGKNTPMWKLLEQSGIVDLVGGESHFVESIQEAIKKTEAEEAASILHETGLSFHR